MIRNFSTAVDCRATLESLRRLGVEITESGGQVKVMGCGLDGLKEPTRELDAQNSGTTMRLLAGLLAGQPFSAIVTGDESLTKRPMQRVAEPLRLMGATVGTDEQGCAPLHIRGARPLRAIRYEPSVASAQVKSAVLLAGLAAEGITTVEEPTRTRDHTERMLREFGAHVEKDGDALSVRGGVTLRARDLLVPGDISSAAFFVAAAVMLPGSDLVIRDVGLNPTRTAFLFALTEMGADIRREDERLEGGEPLGTLRVRGNALKESQTLEISAPVIPNLIDELPLLAFVAASTGCRMELRDARELRFKESDRIAATVENLSRLGARVEERADGWRIHGGRRLHGSFLSSFGDHRIAMACTVAGLAADGPSEVAGARDAVEVSLPEFWDLLEGVAG